MGWNYRFFKHTDDTVWYGIHEVFYKTDESDELDENEIKVFFLLDQFLKIL